MLPFDVPCHERSQSFQFVSLFCSRYPLISAYLIGAMGSYYTYLSPGCANVLMPLYCTSPSKFRLIQQTCATVLRVCGVWSATYPLACLGVCVLQCRWMVDDGHDSPDTSVTLQTLGVSEQQRHPKPLKQLACGAIGAEVGFNDLSRIEYDCNIARECLREWLWSIEVSDCEELWCVARDAELVFQDILSQLQIKNSIG